MKKPKFNQWEKVVMEHGLSVVQVIFSREYIWSNTDKPDANSIGFITIQYSMN